MSSISPSVCADHLRFVLVRTSHPGNIGAAARAIRTMGFGRLVLVAPYRFPDGEAYAFAAGALDVLDRAVVVPDLASAIADCHLVFGATARQRGVPLTEYTPRHAAPRLIESARQRREIAVVFGNERTGLENDELKHCHGAIHIPADAEYSSLNLAQAVQVLAYELRLAMLEETGVPIPLANDPPATNAELEGYFEHLATMLDDIDFHKGRPSTIILLRLRKLFLRANLDQREVRVLRAILADAQRMARLARARGAQGET